MFLGEEADPGNTVTILVAKGRQTKMALASVMPNKSTGYFLCSRVLPFLKEICCDTGDLTVKSDQEPAMQSVIRDLGNVGRRMAAEGSLLNAAPSTRARATGSWKDRYCLPAPRCEF